MRVDNNNIKIPLDPASFCLEVEAWGNRQYFIVFSILMYCQHHGISLKALLLRYHSLMHFIINNNNINKWWAFSHSPWPHPTLSLLNLAFSHLHVVHCSEPIIWIMKHMPPFPCMYPSPSWTCKEATLIVFPLIPQSMMSIPLLWLSLSFKADLILKTFQFNFRNHFNVCLLKSVCW